MAAGLGFIEFTTGDVLSAAAANGYLASQSVMVFATAAARTTAITSPQQGMISFLKDSNTMQFYTGSAWSNVDTGVSPLTTKGDIYGYSTTNARLPVGTNAQILTADSTASTGLKWATAATSGMVLLSTTTLSSTSTTISFVTTYNSLRIAIFGVNHSTSGQNITLQFNSVTSGYFGTTTDDSTTAATRTSAATSIPILFGNGYGTGGENLTNISIPFYSKASIRKPIQIQTVYKTDDATRVTGVTNGVYGSANISAISSITILSTATPTAGTVEIYGVN